MRHFLTNWKPAGSVRAHLLLASAVWSLVGLLLLGRGAHGFSEAHRLVLLPLGILVGTLKSLLLLDRSALKNSRRILDFREGHCLGGVYSWKMWGLVGLMILLGKFLRSSGLPRDFLWLIYVAVGWAMLFSSRKIWLAWYRAAR